MRIPSLHLTCRAPLTRAHSILTRPSCPDSSTAALTMRCKPLLFGAATDRDASHGHGQARTSSHRFKSRRSDVQSLRRFWLDVNDYYSIYHIDGCEYAPRRYHRIDQSYAHTSTIDRGSLRFNRAPRRLLQQHLPNSLDKSEGIRDLDSSLSASFGGQQATCPVSFEGD